MQIRPSYLAYEHRNPLLDKVPHCPRIIVQVSARKPLVCAVEERIVVLGDNYLCQFFPFVPGRIHSGGVMRACMQQYYRTRWRILQGRFETLEVESNGARIIIRVFNWGNSNILENSMMVDCADLSEAREDRKQPAYSMWGCSKRLVSVR